MTCAHRACPRPAYRHGVCMDHLISTLQAGQRAAAHAPHERLARLVAEMRAA
jgi:hypothetical protein